MPGRIVSLYLDDSAVRVMVTRGKRIARLAEMALDEGLSAVDSPEKENALAHKLREFLKFNKINDRKVILGLSGLHCLTRPVILPELPKAMIGEAVAREARRILPMPLEQLYLSWQVISAAGGKTRVFLTAVPRQIADLAVKVVNKAGYKPYMMDIKPIALARLARQSTAVILDVQPGEFDIVVMVNGIPQPVRTIAFPREAVSLQGKIDIVKEDLKRTLEFVKTKGEESQLKPDTMLLVSGELAEHPEFYDLLYAETGLKVDKLASPLKYLKYLEPAQYLVNSGLALKILVKEVGSLVPNFNSLPAPYLPRHISANKLMAAPAAVAALAVLLLLVVNIRDASVDISRIKAQIDSTGYMIKHKQEQRQANITRIASLKDQLQAAENQYQVYSVALQQLSLTGNNLNHDLTVSVNSVQTGLSLSSLNVNNSQVVIGGQADNEKVVFAYVRALTSTGRFTEITITSLALINPSDQEDPSVNFGLNCILKGDRQ